MCSHHVPPPTEQSPLSLPALKLLRAYRRLDIEAIAGLRQPAAVEAEVESALRRFIRVVLEREARSLAFLDEVRAHRPIVGVMARSADGEPLPTT
jgi:DNA repair protein RecO (recombination protein O)